MNRFKAIGYFFNLQTDNQAGMERAMRLAQSNSATMTVIFANKSPISPKQRTILQQKVREKFHYESDIVFLTGHPLVEIIHYIGQQKLDMLMLEPDIPGAIKGFFFGSLTQSLIRKSPCPVWVMKKTDSQTYERVLIAVDPESEEQDALALNKKLLEIGTSLAQRENAECHIIHAWHLYGQDMMESPFLNTPKEEIEVLRMQEKIKREKSFNQLLSQCSTITQDCQLHLVDGDPRVIIPEFIKQQGIDIVVMGTVARTGIKGFVIGNTAEAILSQIHCSIMAIKPDNFQSPLLA